MLGYESNVHPVIQPARPWGEFFGKMTVPSSSLLFKRLEDNVLYYQTNYLMIALLVQLLVMFVVKKKIYKLFSRISHSVVLFLVPIYLLLFYITFIRKASDIIIANKRISKNASFVILAGSML